MSLKDQLLKSGLVDPKQAKRAAHQQRLESKQQGRTEREAAEKKNRDEAQRQVEAQKQRDKELMAQRNTEQLEKEKARSQQAHREAVINEAYRSGVWAKWEGQRPFYFLRNQLVESLLVSESAAEKLAAGEAAIVAPRTGQGSPVVITAAAARNIREIEPERILVLFDR